MKQEIKICDECESEYYAGTSEMKELCPECSHYLYNYKNCPHYFSNGRCIKCYWNGRSSDYVKRLKNNMWTPITFSELNELIESGISKMSPDDIKLWKEVSINPEKWQEVELGEEGNGFWAVAIKGNQVIWYNDIEEGFNISPYSNYGKIDEYNAEQDELQMTIRKVRTSN